ncbi:MAG: ATP phosphoribosyltransferase regulatory subunit, partial [Clostridiales bacterium]|nr:ATP phosphoribosyltransferase regulatory subunit [Clostridiales bacterium]
MKKYSVSTPEGTRDKLFSECSLRRELTNRLKALFSRRGYQEVITPSVEYYDVFLDSGTPLEPESMLKLIDRAGRILVMRPDVTTPIARIAATKLASVEAPYRLCYVQNVFRSDIEHTGRNMETLQAGVELLGASGIRPDVEMIAMAVESLNMFSLKDYRLEIGHAGFFKAITAALGASDDKIEEMRRLVEEKNFAALNDVLKEYGKNPYST